MLRHQLATTSSGQCQPWRTRPYDTPRTRAAHPVTRTRRAAGERSQGRRSRVAEPYATAAVAV
ncbi:hypothetical protein AQJ11_21410 [Streptomyces corchorusii]|uniref:Uncharacterized protein n=1 Tax=Streptomyces corchorusii TaxID=1903 RepID=A0A101Q8Z3_STRCK|nr:hypothetical protein SHJG_6771 [Streptomyces hygroscopicus subsp. jinggangensis 5008]AGF66194.1 hypothetical protein SHJGH_6531 [Streptomyces hygroscopicus subsp. jinggangensis TL01]KUN25435.1 hypothetical protein AQJ11_21410 [Streptomyces corchorusii]